MTATVSFLFKALPYFKLLSFYLQLSRNFVSCFLNVSLMPLPQLKADRSNLAGMHPNSANLRMFLASVPCMKSHSYPFL